MLRAPLLLLALLGSFPLSAQVADTTLSRARALAEAGAWAQAADLFQRALAGQPEDAALLAETIDALEACGRWREAIPLLDRYLAQVPGDPRRHAQRGQYAAWAGDRGSGLAHLRRAAALAPRDAAILAALGEVLSWEPNTRPEAREILAASLRLDPVNTRAVVALANLDAWAGRPQEAMPRYDAVLRDHPTLVAALLGKSGALEQVNRHGEAHGLLLEARRLQPDDPYLAARQARLELALGRPRVASRLLEAGGAGDGREFRPVRDSVRRALRPSMGLAGQGASRERQLDRTSVMVDLTLAPADPLRLRLLAEPVRYRDQAGANGGASYGGGLTWATARFGIDAELRRRDLGGGLAASWVGGGRVSWAPSRRLRLEGGWTRSPVEESRRAAFGTSEGGTPRGAVHAGLATATLVLDDLPGGLAVRAEALAGSYGGAGWASNGRVGGSAEVTVPLHSTGPHVRLGYAAQATRFEFNADSSLASAPDQAAGYFSPRLHVLHQAVLQVSHRITDRLGWSVDGRAGREAVRAQPGAALQWRTAIVATASVDARLTAGLDLRVGYLYVDAFNAFRMHQATLGLRQYF